MTAFGASDFEKKFFQNILMKTTDIIQIKTCQGDDVGMLMSGILRKEYSGFLSICVSNIQN